MQNYDAISGCALFDGIAETELKGMLGCLGARMIRFEKGAAILQEGSPARELGILAEGNAQVIRVDYFGNRSIMAHVHPGQLFAESFACAQAEKLPVSVIAVEPCTVLLLDCRRVLSSCSNACAFHNKIIYNLLQIVAKKNLSLHRRALITGKRSTREKLMTYLLEQAKHAGKSEFSIPFDRQGLADYLEVDRSGLSAEMSKLKKEGFIEFSKNRFALLHKGLDQNER